MTAALMTTPTDAPSSGARLFTADGRELPLAHTDIAVEAKGGIARTILTQRFVNTSDDALTVTYLLPLPADGAVSGYCFTLEGERIVSEIDRKQAARERFESAIASGHTASLLEQERSSVFTQKVGNIPPRSEVECEVVVDQRLIWAGEHDGAWAYRFPTVVGPRYMGHAGRVKDAARITVDVADQPLTTTLEIAMSIGDTVVHDRMAESPSHPIRCDRDGPGRTVNLDASSGARLDRDIIVRWPVSKPEVGLQLAAGRPAREALSGHAYGLLTLVPPDVTGHAKSVARDLILLIDTSGSMGGRPLDQAKRVLSKMIESLAPHDRLEMIEFSSRPNRWKREPVVATRDGKRAALAWLEGLAAGGGTEMKTGLLEALTPLRDGAQRQVVLVTDGYIGFEGEIVRTVLEKLPKSCRLHTVGVGSAPNRSLLTPAARAGGGVEITLAIDEDVERGAKRIVEKTAAPLVTEVEVIGDALERCMPHVVPDLYAGCPALVPVELSPLGGRVTVRGRTADGVFEHHAEFAPLALGEGHQAVAALFAREWVEDLETLRAVGGDVADVDTQIETVGLDYEIATRLTSFVAVSKSTIDPALQRRETVMPHELPYGASIEGFGLRAPVAPPDEVMTMSGFVRGRSRAPFETPVAGESKKPPLTARKKPKRAERIAERSSGAADEPDLDGARQPLGRSGSFVEGPTGPIELDRSLLSDHQTDDDLEEGYGGGAAESSTDDIDEVTSTRPMPRSPAPARDKGAAAPEDALKEAKQESAAFGAASEPESNAALPPAPGSTRVGGAPRTQMAEVELTAESPEEMPPPSAMPKPVRTDETKALRKRGPSPLVWALGLSLGVIVILLLLWFFFGTATPDSPAPPPPTVESAE